MRRDLPHRFEGDQTLASLLASAGCELTVAEVRLEFEAALEEDPDTAAGEILPLLFETEPRFPDAEAASRLYANLLGLWDQVAARPAGALPVLQDAPAGPRPLPEAPEGAVDGTEIPGDYVTFAARTLVEGDEKVRRRAEDRLENRQGALLDLVRDHLADAPPEAEEIAVGLLVIAHEAFRRAFGEARVGPARPEAFRAALAAPPAEADAAGDPQPALAAYQAEILDEATLTAEDPLPVEARPAVGRALKAARVALTGALR